MSAPGQDLSKLADEAREEGRWSDAAMLYGVLAKAKPDDPDILCWHGYALWQNGDLEDAIAEYKRAGSVAPTWSGVHNCLGTIHRQLGNMNEALAQYRVAIQKSPFFAEAHANLGETLWMLGDLAAATASYRRAVELNPDWAELYDDLARVLEEQGLYAEAGMAAREAIRLEPELTEAQCTLAMVLSRQDRHDEAEATLAPAFKAAPDDASPWSRLAWIRWRAKKFDDAGAAAREAVRRDPTLPYPHFVLGAAASNRGERDEAIAHYRRYLELDPDDAEGAMLGLSHLGAVPVPEKASESYMKHLYAGRSRYWDENVDGETRYRAPMQIADALALFMGPRKDLDIIDVGCGTGLCGPLLRERARKLDGLDLSAHMLERARARGVYDELLEGDLESILYARPERYDVVASAATLIHFGDLAAPLKACAAALRPEGWMSFTVFPNTDGGVGVLPFFCHSHSPEHIRERAKGAGFDVVSIEEDVHEYHGDKPVPGLVVVLRKGKPT